MTIFDNDYKICKVCEMTRFDKIWKKWETVINNKKRVMGN